LRVTAVRFLFSLPNVYPYSGLDVHTTDLFFRCEVEETEHSLHFADDAEEGFWIPGQALDASQFGLHSIRQAITRFQQENGSEILKK
ncbi:MAG: DNA mismatch repair protein MutT, partial [Prevotella sp.]|nr:DNA mismatch repair protein MutT [Prevotella sp.]